MAEPLLIAKHGANELCLLPALANRHGLVTGATGTGKTVTLQAMAQRFSAIGVPVFMADVKGDLSGIARPGGGNAKVDERVKLLGVELAFEPCPVVFWDVFGKDGHPVRATVSDMGPLLLSRMLSLNPTQEGVLNIVFRVADDSGLLLLDLKDLRAMLSFVADNARTVKVEYGNVSPASVGAIQRGLLALESQGANSFFGEPMLDIADLMQTDGKGRGVVNILAADQLMTAPKLYATFLLWMLAELFENLPEVGDPEKPRLVFFFDEAHLLFDDAPKALLDRIEQVVRLIRSKGVGVYFVTQNPLDIPDAVLGQLGNRVQHALRAFTPRDQKAVRAAAETMRPNPKLDVAAAITELGVGEALVSFLDPKGRPQMVERALVVPPGSQLGPISGSERKRLIQSSVVFGHYEKAVDRESAYEKLRGRAAQAEPEAAPARDPQRAPQPAARERGIDDHIRNIVFGRTGPRGGRQSQGVLEAMAKSAARSIGSGVGRSILRGVLGSILGSGKRR
ncbi:MAG: ATP-binding protein [Betaproteobacteria bacterium SG8_39]|nr:MAG: ATP-binding protein [Betaproteobacteria bacterium SG8_39]